ncbi:DUF4133 domain-containing protein [Pedobacter jeongneungensis]|uniref:DUF4133 domain-containing protein n=1 Tax=Pedobacter jeongneungensis TaxID=947309 RepID=UPI0004698A14|nr:DUF4133 domain-containing protein [Pedobacter jeongneungensis]
MSKRIYKAADSTPEFLGVDGPYINYVLYCGFGSLTLFLIMVGAGVVMYVAIPLGALLIVGTFLLVKYISNKYGSSGIDKELIKSKSVDVIYSNDPNIFKNLTK